MESADNWKAFGETLNGLFWVHIIIKSPAIVVLVRKLSGIGSVSVGDSVNRSPDKSCGGILLNAALMFLIDTLSQTTRFSSQVHGVYSTFEQLTAER